MNTKPVQDVAEVIARTGPDPMLLAVIVVVLLGGAALVGWIIKNGEARNRDVMEDYQTRMNQLQEGAREEQKEQRASHEQSLTRLSESFERSLDKVVATNEASVGKIVDRLDKMDARLIHVETRLAPAVIVNAVGQTEEVRK